MTPTDLAETSATTPSAAPDSNEAILASYRSRHRYHLPDGLSLRKILAEDCAAHYRDWTLPGFRAVAVHRFGVWCQSIRFAPARVLLNRLHLHLYRRVRNRYGIEISYTVALGRRVVVEHQSGIIIHGFSTIGDGSIIRQGVTLGVKSAARPFDAPILGKNVDVGAGAKILGRVHIGDGAKIGANAVVITDVPPGATAVGIPARIIEAKQ